MKPKTYAERTAVERRLIGAHVTCARVQRRKSKEAVAARLEISLEQLTALEHGEAEFSALQIYDLTQFFGSTWSLLVSADYYDRQRFPIVAGADDPFALAAAALVTGLPSEGAKAEALAALRALAAVSDRVYVATDGEIATRKFSALEVKSLADEWAQRTETGRPRSY